ncbi:MAG: ribonuclease protein component [Sphingomonadales bacterium]|jgi:ribonuclease P protein component|nr:ribonuclease protein component [Sphingomonadales bacterium]
MPGFVLLLRERGDGDPAIRLGLTVSRKVGGAVVRNRMKRRFRALARELLPESGLGGSDLVLIGRPGGIERDYGVLREELRKALGKVSKNTVRAEPVEALPSSTSEKGEGRPSTGSGRTVGGKTGAGDADGDTAS